MIAAIKYRYQERQTVQVAVQEQQELQVAGQLLVVTRTLLQMFPAVLKCHAVQVAHLRAQKPLQSVVL